MAYKLGKKSLKELQGVKCELQMVVKRAIQLTTQDFSVHDGLRTIVEQRHMVRTRASRTMKSKHLTGDAVDLVPYINGKLRWEWPAIYPIAEAVRQAANEQGVKLVWGGVWDRIFTDTEAATEGLVQAYVKRKRKQYKSEGRKNKSVFIDGPHFQLA